MKIISILVVLLGSNAALAHSKCTSSAFQAAKNFVSMRTQISSNWLMVRDYEEWPTYNFKVQIADQTGRRYLVTLRTNANTCEAGPAQISAQ